LGPEIHGRGPSSKGEKPIAQGVERSIDRSRNRSSSEWKILFAAGIGRSPGAVMVLIVSTHCAASVVLCDGFSNWSRVWGRVAVCRSVCLGVSGRKGGKIRRIFAKIVGKTCSGFQEW